MTHRRTPAPARTASSAEPGLKVHTQFLPVDRATQIRLQQFI